MRKSGLVLIFTMILSAAFSQASFAYSSMGSWKDDNWKVNAARSVFNLNDPSKSTTLHINHSGVPEAHPVNVTELVVVVNGNVYVATGEAARDALAGKEVDPSRMVQIGRNARSDDKCGFRCQGGLLEQHRNITFDTVGGQQRRLPQRQSHH